MDIKEIDKNFITVFNVPEDAEWFSIREKPFQLYGIEFLEEEGIYRRLLSSEFFGIFENDGKNVSCFRETFK